MSTDRGSIIVLSLLVAACGSRGPATLGELGNPPAPDARSPAADRAQGGDDLSIVRPDRPAGRDGKPVPGPDYGLCAPCKTGEVYLISHCVTTDKLFTCGQACTPGAPNTCPAGSECKQWGATPCCVCSAAVPACVPTSLPGGKIVGPLRIHPESGIAGQKVQITVSGAPFYVGALFYNIRMGNEVRPEEGSSGKECSIAATFTPPSPGLHVVEVSQYGGGPPWALAGFYTASGGVLPMPTIQPGYQCSMSAAPGDPACASALPYSCKCLAGRCTCQ